MLNARLNHMPKNVGKKGNKHVEQKNQVIVFFKGRNFSVNFLENNQIELETFSEAGENLIDYISVH